MFMIMGITNIKEYKDEEESILGFVRVTLYDLYAYGIKVFKEKGVINIGV
jgi:hypothetical protein